MIHNKEELFEMLVKDRLDNNNISVLKILKDEQLNSAELSRRINVSPPLMSYYLNGNTKSRGLVELGLIKRVHNEKGVSVGFEITELGLEILKILK